MKPLVPSVAPITCAFLKAMDVIRLEDGRVCAVGSSQFRMKPTLVLRFPLGAILRFDTEREANRWLDEQGALGLHRPTPAERQGKKTLVSDDDVSALCMFASLNPRPARAWQAMAWQPGKLRILRHSEALSRLNDP